MTCRYIHFSLLAIKVSADHCDQYINNTSTCHLTKKIGAKAVLKINVNGEHEASDIKWFRRVKIREKTSNLLLDLEDKGKLPRNMFLSYDRQTLEVIKIRNYDTASNSFKVEVKSRQHYINFIIDVIPIEIGPKLLGASVVININDYIQLPKYASLIDWYIEGAHSNLPNNAELEDDGKKLVIQRIENKDYQMYVCIIYSDKNYFLAKRRFRLLRAQELTKDPPTYPSTVYRPLGNSIKFKVKVHGASTSSLVWYKDQNVVSSRHGALLSDDKQQMSIPKIQQGLFGTYTCALQGKDKKSSININFTLKKPVIPVAEKLSHHWNLNVLRSIKDGVKVLDLVTGSASPGQVNAGCIETKKGISEEAISMNMKNENCNGKLELLDSKSIEECVIDPQVCHDGFSLSIWLKIKMIPLISSTDVLCTRPYGLCITCTGEKQQKDLLKCMADITSGDQKWKLIFNLQSSHWQFLVITWSPISECRVFVNGEVKGSTLGQSLAKPSPETQSSFVLGMADIRIQAESSELHGLVDELLIWNQVVLSPKQVATMFVQFHGIDKPEINKVVYNHTVDMGENLKLTCPFDLPPVFRSQLRWISGSRELDEYTGRQTIIVPVDRPKVFTCQYFNGFDLVPSDKFFLNVNGYKSITNDGSKHEANMSNDAEPAKDEDAHHQKILKDLDQSSKGDTDFKEYPCLSYPCKHGGTCAHKQHTFKLNGTKKTAYTYKCHCTDNYRGINCEQESTSCDAYPCTNGKCLDDGTEAGYRCLCYYGYQGETCSEDVNECIDVNDCSPHADCLNNQGSYSCKCHNGYEGDGKHCIAIAVDVALIDSHICTSVLKESKLCIIESDQMRSCDITFAVNISGIYKLKDVVWSKHWAELNTNGPNAVGYKAEPTKFMVSENGTRKGIKCWESDFAENFYKVEVRNGHIPPPYYMFKLVHRSIELGPKIPGTPFELSVYYYGVFPDKSWSGKWVNPSTGNYTVLVPPRLTYEYRVEKLPSSSLGFLIYYGYDKDGYQVATRLFHDQPDVDECLESTDTCLAEMSECQNLPGSYKCVCHKGYKKTGSNCLDIDECIENNNCNENAQCTNTDGAYTCTCLEGFHGDGAQCNEIDCPLLGQFDNGQILGLSHSFGSTVLFRCYIGYRLDGSPKLKCKETGMWNSLKPMCIDINECEVTNYCDSNAICHNEPGDYRCECKRGYEGDGMRCIDIDECASSNPCHEHAVCVNRDGGFGCTCFHQSLGSPSSDCSGSSGYSTEYLNSFEGGTLMPPVLPKYQQSDITNLAEILPFMEYENFNKSMKLSGPAPGQVSEQSFHKGDHVMALEGSSYDIPCIPSSIMNSMVMIDPEFMWIRDNGAKLDQNHYRPSENGNLHFFEVAVEDSGPFVCRVSYSEITGGGYKERSYKHLLTVYATATPLCDISVTYFTESCEHATNYQHRNSFLSSLAKKVCLKVGCTVMKFDMECHRVQELIGANVNSVFQLEYLFTLEIVIHEFFPCNATCVVGQLQSYVAKVLRSLDEFVQHEEMKAKRNQIYKIMSNSWTHSVRFVCREGYARHEYICDACPPGSSSNGEVCRPCRQGYYQSNYTSPYCKACPHQQITKNKGTTSLEQCYVEKLGEKIVGGIIGGIVTLACILAVIIYRVVVKHCKGSPQDIAFRRLSEAVEDTVEIARDKIKNRAEDLAFRAEIAKSEYADKKLKKNTRRNVKSRALVKRKSKRPSSSEDTDDRLSKTPSNESLPTDSESYESSQGSEHGSHKGNHKEGNNVTQVGSHQGSHNVSHQGSHNVSHQGSRNVSHQGSCNVSLQGSHNVHFPGSSKTSQIQHSSQQHQELGNKQNRSFSRLPGNPLEQTWSQYSGHNAPQDTYINPEQQHHFEKEPLLYESYTNRTKAMLEDGNFEYSDEKHENSYHLDASPYNTPTVVNNASLQNLRRSSGSRQRLAEIDPDTEGSHLPKQEKTNQINITQPLSNRIPLAPPPPPLLSGLPNVESDAFGFPPPPPNF
ncbi:uncharacterized protein [Antedon mediterranea]|uniref:uncharacterized protein n=1 Tax=Antedon mediterranea TaxID=105859 RepID=UPI003AF5B06C